MAKILEIGGGRNPYFIRYSIPWNEKDVLTIVDSDPQNIQFAKDEIEKHKKEGGVYPHELNIFIKDATYLDFEENIFDEVVISNTLSAPIHNNWDRDGNFVSLQNKEGEQVSKRPIIKINPEDDPFYIERRNLIDEAIRVLKPGGVISIYTDLIIYGLESYQKIIREMKEHSELIFYKDIVEESRINKLNQKKLLEGKFCCCFRAEVLPQSEVLRFRKK